MKDRKENFVILPGKVIGGSIEECRIIMKVRDEGMWIECIVKVGMGCEVLGERKGSGGIGGLVIVSGYYNMVAVGTVGEGKFYPVIDAIRVKFVDKFVDREKVREEEGRGESTE